MSLKEKMARDLESQGFIVIRAWQLSSPDIIAFRAQHAAQITAISIVTGDEPRTGQKAVLESLRIQGINVTFDYPEEAAASTRIHRTHAELIEFQEDLKQMGRLAYWSNAAREAFPQDFKKGTNSWYHQKNAWQEGWDDAHKFKPISSAPVSED